MGKNSVKGGQPIMDLSEQHVGKVVSDASGGGPVLNGVIVGINFELQQYRVAVPGEVVNRSPSKLLILADSVTDHLATSLDRVRDAHRAQLRGLAKDLNLLGREQNVEDEIRTVLTDNGVTPAPEVYRLRVEASFFLDVRPQSVNAFDKVTSGTPDLDWLTNSIKVRVERSGTEPCLYIEPDSDFEFEELYVDMASVVAVTELGE
jgi:hypothetical protein